MAQLTLRFSANRTVREYTEQRYLPAAAAYRSRTANDGDAAKQMVDWQHALKEKWSSLHFGETKVEAAGSEHHFETRLFLGGLSPEAVKVQVYVEDDKGAPVVCDMERAQTPEDGPSGAIYRGSVPATRPARDYTVRAVPFWPGVPVPLEADVILWQH